MADGKKWGTLGGGSGKMHKFTPSGTQTPGQSSQEGKGGSRRGIEPQAGGHAIGFSTGASNKSYAGTQTPGQSSQQPSGGDGKFAKGGTTKMLGNRGSQRAEAGKSSP